MRQILKNLGFILILFLISCNSKNEKVVAKTNAEKSNVPSGKNKLETSKKSELSPIKIDSFLITENSVGIFNKGMTISKVIQLIPEKQIKKKIGYGEFEEDTYDDYEIYDEYNRHLVTLTPLIQNNLNSTINRILIIDHRFKTESGISVNSTYSELLKLFKVSDYSPDIKHVVLSVGQLGAWFSIRKTELEQGWWNEESKKINKSKIPSDSHFDSFVIWWK